MTSLGMILRQAREAQGRTVADVAEALCITRAYVRAMEADDLTSLPSPFFYKAFVKQYAEWLGVPEQKWQALLPAPPPAPEPEPVIEQSPVRQHVFRVPDPILEAANKLDLSGRRVGTSLAALTLAVVGCTSFYGWWMERPEGPAAEQPAVVSQAAATTRTVADEEEEIPSLDVTTTTDADGVRHVVLNLSAKETTWLSITSEGKSVFSGTLSPSETKTLTAPEVARMKVGNAGGLDIRWNGKPIGPIGESGEVRVVLFTPEEFRIIKPEPKPVEDPAESL